MDRVRGFRGLSQALASLSLPQLRRASRVVCTMTMLMRTAQVNRAPTAGASSAFQARDVRLLAYVSSCTPLQRPSPEPFQQDWFGTREAHWVSGRSALSHSLSPSPMLRRHNVCQHAVAGRFPVFSTVDFTKKRCRKWRALFSGVLAACVVTTQTQFNSGRRRGTFLWPTSHMAHGPA